MGPNFTVKPTAFQVLGRVSFLRPRQYSNATKSMKAVAIANKTYFFSD